MRSAQFGVFLFLVCLLPRPSLAVPLHVPHGRPTTLLPLFFLSHGLAIDAVILTAATCKHKSWYQWVHLLTSLLFAGLLFAETLLTGLGGVGLWHPLLPPLDLLTLSLIVACFVSGVVVQRIIQSVSDGRYFATQKVVHRALGLAILFLVKAKLMSLMAVTARQREHFWLFALIYSFVWMVAYGYFLFFSDPHPTDTALGPLYKRHDGRRFRDILGRLTGHADTIEWVSPTEEAVLDPPDHLRSPPPVAWYLFGNKLCEAPNFPHSGGQFLIHDSFERDITKACLGVHPWVYRNPLTDRLLLFQYSHGKKFRNEIQKACFGVISLPVFRRRLERTASLDMADEHSPLVADRATDRDYKRHKIYEHMGHQVNVHFSLRLPDAPFHLVFIAKDSESTCDYHVDLRQDWTVLLGRYLLANFQLHGRHLCYGIRCLSPNYLRFRQRFLSTLDQELFAVHAAIAPPLLTQVAALPDAPGDAVTSNFVVAVVGSACDVRGDKFTMSDYLGFGLQWLTSASGPHLILAHNEGLVPFLDFFELIFQKLLFHFHGKEAANAVFDAEFRRHLSGSPLFHVYWVVDEAFAAAAATLGAYHLRLIKEVQKRLGCEDTDLLGRVWVEGAPAAWNGQGFFQEPPQPLQSIAQVFKLPVDPQKVLLSGDGAFVRRLCEGGSLPKHFFDRIVFI